MKRILILAALLASVSTACADTIPAKFRGEWCDPSGAGSMFSVPLRRCGVGDSPVLLIRPDGFRFPDGHWDCAFTSVKPYAGGVSTDSRCIHGRRKPYTVRSIWTLEDDGALKFLNI